MVTRGVRAGHGRACARPRTVLGEFGGERRSRTRPPNQQHFPRTKKEKDQSIAVRLDLNRAQTERCCCRLRANGHRASGDPPAAACPPWPMTTATTDNHIAAVAILRPAPGGAQGFAGCLHTRHRVRRVASRGGVQVLRRRAAGAALQCLIAPPAPLPLGDAVRSRIAGHG